MEGSSRPLLVEFRLLRLHVEADAAYRPGGDSGFDLDFTGDYKRLQTGRVVLILRVVARPREGARLPFGSLDAVGMGTFQFSDDYATERDVPLAVQLDAGEAVYNAMRATIVAATAAMPSGPHRLNAIDWDNEEISVQPPGATRPDFQAYVATVTGGTQA